METNPVSGRYKTLNGNRLGGNFATNFLRAPDVIMAATALTALTISQPNTHESEALLKGVAFSAGFALAVNRFVRKIGYSHYFINVIADEDFSSLVIDAKPINSATVTHTLNKTLYSGFTASVASFQAAGLGFIFFNAASHLPAQDAVTFAIPALCPYAVDVADHFRRAYKVYTNKWHLVDEDDIEAEMSHEIAPRPV